MKKIIKTARSTRSSAALKSAYFKKLMALIDKMQGSVEWWLGAKYRARESEIIFDESPSKALEHELLSVMDGWHKDFDEMSATVSEWFVRNAAKYTNTSILSALKDAGYTVKFQSSRRIKDVIEAITIENVNLIKSIESQYLTEVTGIVMRSVQEGRDLHYLTEELQTRYGVTKRRAATIARDQNNKATAMIANTRYEELGVEEAMWQHNAGGRVPRLSHLAANGKKYKISEGFLIEGKLTYPGQEVNCHCTGRPVIPSFIKE